MLGGRWRGGPYKRGTTVYPVGTKFQNRCQSCTYTYMQFEIKIWGFNQHLTDTLRYHQNKAAMCSILLAAITLVCLLVEGKVNFARSSSPFFESFRKLQLPGQVERLAWKTTTNYMDLVWFEDHSISAELVRGSDDNTDLTHEQVFSLNNLFFKFQLLLI